MWVGVDVCACMFLHLFNFACRKYATEMQRNPPPPLLHYLWTYYMKTHNHSQTPNNAWEQREKRMIKSRQARIRISLRHALQNAHLDKFNLPSYPLYRRMWHIAQKTCSFLTKDRASLGNLDCPGLGYIYAEEFWFWNICSIWLCFWETGIWFGLIVRFELSTEGWVTE